jgi:uncharacterized membrane protein YphA (DoxX/SURF4 family)
MLSLFPDLLDWSWYVPFFFRVFLGIYCCSLGWMLAHEQNAATTEHDHFAWLSMRTLLVSIGLLFVAGIAVQALGAIGFALALFALFLKWKRSPYAKESATFYLLICLVSLSLIFLGAGPYAFDLPL